MIKLKDKDLNFSREIQYAKKHIWSPKHLVFARKQSEEYWRQGAFKITKWDNTRVFQTPCAPTTAENKGGFMKANHKLQSKQWRPIIKT